MKKQENNQELTTNLYTQIMGDKTSYITKVKDERDSVIKTIETLHNEVVNLRKQKREIIKNMRIQKRALRKNKFEKFKLRRELNVQQKLTNQLTEMYTNEENCTINVFDFYPETSKQKAR